MSRPANPLASFRSYSYYHVLVVCESSEAADALSKNTKIEKWLHPTAPNPNSPSDGLGRFAVKFVDEAARKFRYCVLINGATDAEFSIVRASWRAYTAADATMMDQGTSIAVEGELDISEPKGVVFLDKIVKCTLALGIDAAQCVFMLKTFFIGHADNPNIQEDQYYITDVEPLMFIAMNITASFSETGGLYHMLLQPITHGAARVPQYGKSASGFNITAGTLKDTLDRFAKRIEDNYEALFKCVQLKVTEELQGDRAKQIKNLLTRVKYRFELDKDYESPDYQITDGMSQVKDKAGCDDYVKIPIPANMAIEDALHLIMKKCRKVTAEESQGVRQDDGKLLHYEYKIHGGIQSKRGDDEKLEYTVVYRIVRFMRPKDVSLFDVVRNKVDDLDLSTIDRDKLSPLQQQLKDNLISFDYIYTGKNIDIVEFDIKMNLGLAYFQIAVINNTLKERLATTPVSVTNVSAYDATAAYRFGEPAQIPVFFGSQIRMPSLRNKQSPTENAEAGYSLSKHASLEVTDVTMKIHGNPRLVGTINRATNSENIGKSPPQQNDGPRREATFRDWSTYPSFAKINIKMPRNNDDIALFRNEVGTGPDAVGGGDFTQDFWFTGFYYVVAIEHLFDGGEFTQVLSLQGQPQNQAIGVINKQGNNEKDLKLLNQVYECYDSRVDRCAETYSGTEGRLVVVKGKTENEPSASGSPNPRTASEAHGANLECDKPRPKDKINCVENTDIDLDTFSQAEINKINKT